jgi:ABC-type multidrug transport system fused ATPase/permease subunit
VGIAGLGLTNYALNGMFAISLSAFTRALMSGNRPMLKWSVMLFVVAGLAASLGVLFAGRALVIGAVRSERHVRSAAFAAVNRLPLTALERLGPGEVLSRLTNDTAVVGQMYKQTLQDVANTLCAGFGSVITVLAIERLMKGRTTLVIAHRLSRCRTAPAEGHRPSPFYEGDRVSDGKTTSGTATSRLTPRTHEYGLQK